jgi:molybdopterin/thiamine biosynthesis adenylyltransferase
MWLICVFNEERSEDDLLGSNCIKLYSKSRVQDVKDKRSSAENCILWIIQCFDAGLLGLLQFTIRPVISASNVQHATYCC